MTELVPLPVNIAEDGNAQLLPDESDAESIPTSHIASVLPNYHQSGSNFRITHAYKERSARLTDLKNRSTSGRDIDPDVYENLKPELEMDEHTLSVEEILNRFKS
eukprot:16307_2